MVKITSNLIQVRMSEQMKTFWLTTRMTVLLPFCSTIIDTTKKTFNFFRCMQNVTFTFILEYILSFWMFHYTPLENTQLIIYSKRVNQNIQKLLSCPINIRIAWCFVMRYLLVTVRITLNTQIWLVTRSSFLMSQQIIHKISNGLIKVNHKYRGSLIKKKNIESLNIV